MGVCRAGCQVVTLSTLLSLVPSQSFVKCKLPIHYCYYCCDYILLPFFKIHRHITHWNTVLWYWNDQHRLLIQWRFTLGLGHLTPVKWHLASLVSTELIPGCSHSSQSTRPFCWQTPPWLRDFLRWTNSELSEIPRTLQSSAGVARPAELCRRRRGLAEEDVACLRVIWEREWHEAWCSSGGGSAACLRTGEAAIAAVWAERALAVSNAARNFPLLDVEQGLGRGFHVCQSDSCPKGFYAHWFKSFSTCPHAAHIV